MELWLVATGFGVMPMAALALLRMTPTRMRSALAWGALTGIVAFLGLAHASTTALVLRSQYAAGPAASAVTLAIGMAAGMAVGGWFLGAGRLAGTPSGVAWAAVVFLAVHSVGDGLVLGEAYAGTLPPGWNLTVLNVSATFLHRAAEGSLVVVPAFAAAWKPAKTSGLVLVGLLTVPAAFVPVALYAPGVSITAVTMDQTVALFLASVEMGVAIALLLLGLVPRMELEKGPRGARAAGLAFLAMFLIHFAVE